MKLSDSIDRIEYISDDNGSIESVEIRETSEDGKILNIYCSRRMNLSNLILVLEDREEEIEDVLIDIPCRIKIQLDSVDAPNRTCSFECDLYKYHVFIVDMSSRKSHAYEVEKQITSEIESGKIDLLESLEIRPILKNL